MNIFLLIVFAYLYGSIPFSVLVPKFLGVNIMESGSKNPGFTNVLRVCGPGPGFTCLVLDMTKGFLPAFIAGKMGIPVLGSIFSMQCLAGFIGVLGHCYSPFLKMKGGKGVAAAGGLIFALHYLLVLILAATLILVIAVTQYMSIASITAAVVFPIGVYFLYGEPSYCVVPSLYTLFIIFKHRANIKRLLNGTENKFSFGKKSK
ncbi:MAG: glycerol-3-phosphate 1-O-acyltransferase PlsY [Bacillota bacterium]|nr:glycerol-3-phosphate 1-O-acyltransferase PlsY [Bacillota bacterium]